MGQITEQLVAFNKANVESAIRLAGIALDGAERTMKVQLKTAKSMLDDAAKRINLLIAAKDVSDFAQLANTLAQPNLEHVNSYLKGTFELANGVQSEISELVEQYINDYNSRAAVMLDEWAKSAPAGSEAAFAAARSALSAGKLAADNVAKSVKQFAEMRWTGVEAEDGGGKEGRRKAA